MVGSHYAGRHQYSRGLGPGGVAEGAKGSKGTNFLRAGAVALVQRLDAAAVESDSEFFLT